VSHSAETARDVEAALHEGRYQLREVCRDLGAAVRHLEETGAAAVLADIDPQPAGMLAGLDLLTKRFADTRFIVLSSTLQSDLMLEAMQVGARHFLQKRSITAELDGVLRRLVPETSSASGRLGSVVALLAASGGCGVTTLAINLAHELHLLSGEPALLVDLDCHYGAAATNLGVSGQFGIADVLARNGQLDAELVRSTAKKYSDGLEVLISPATVNMAAPAALHYDRLRGVLRICAQTYSHTIVDAPRVSMDVAAQLAAGSDRLLIVLQLTVKDIATTRAMVAALQSGGVPQERLTVLVNRYHKRRSMVTLEDAREALRGLDIACVGNDYASAIKGLNYGRPLALSAPRSALQREIRQLATRFVGAAKTS
jgi:pilus assembly protein CpaE